MHNNCIGSGSSPRALRQNATSHVTAKHPLSSPQSSTVQNKATVSTLTTRPVQAIDTCEDEDIYTLPGPPMSKALTAKNEVEYYNIPPSKNQPPCTNRAENQLTAAGATSLVTGSSSKSVKATSSKKPAITPKPTNKGNQGMKNTATQYTQCNTVNFATETATFNVVSGIATTRPPVLRDGVVM